MRIYLWTGLVVSLLAITHWACVKGNPVGADVYNPFTPTPTPVITTITVSVLDGTTAQAGITVVALEPSGVMHVATTDSLGVVKYTTQIFGTWNIQVPTQGNFYASDVSASVVSNTLGPSVIFTAQGQQLAVSPLTAESYGILGANITYQVTYTQPSNLIEPIVLSTAGAITEAGWTANFSPVTIGQVGNTSQLNIIVPSGSTQQPTFQVEAKRLDGTALLTSAARYISKNYSVQTNWIVNAVGYSPSSNYSFIGNLNLSTLNVGDLTTTWIANISSNSKYGSSIQTADGTYGNNLTDSFQMLPGSLKPITITSNCFSNNPLTIMVTLSSAAANIHGGVTFSNACTIVAGSFFTMTN
jgi:hypothetical protein